MEYAKQFVFILSLFIFPLLICMEADEVELYEKNIEENVYSFNQLPNELQYYIVKIYILSFWETKEFGLYKLRYM